MDPKKLHKQRHLQHLNDRLFPFSFYFADGNWVNATPTQNESLIEFIDKKLQSKNLLCSVFLEPYAILKKKLNNQ